MYIYNKNYRTPIASIEYHIQRIKERIRLTHSQLWSIIIVVYWSDCCLGLLIYDIDTNNWCIHTKENSYVCEVVMVVTLGAEMYSLQLELVAWFVCNRVNELKNYFFSLFSVECYCGLCRRVDNLYVRRLLGRSWYRRILFHLQ